MGREPPYAGSRLNDRRRVHRERVDALPPGQYVARAVVSRQGEEIGRRWRSFEIAQSPARLVGYRWRDAAGLPVPAPSASPALAAEPPVDERDGKGIESLVEVVRPLVRAETHGRLIETERPFTFEPSFFEGVDGRTYVPYTITVDGGRLDGRPSARCTSAPSSGTRRSRPTQPGTVPPAVFEDVLVTTVTAGPQSTVSGALDVAPGSYDVYTAIREAAEAATILLAKEGLTVPEFETPELRLSSVLVGDIEVLDAPLSPDRQRLEPYTIGAFRVVPRRRLSFSPPEELSFLYFVHGAGPPAPRSPT